MNIRKNYLLGMFFLGAHPNTWSMQQEYIDVKKFDNNYEQSPVCKQSQGIKQTKITQAELEQVLEAVHERNMETRKNEIEEMKNFDKLFSTQIHLNKTKEQEEFDQALHLETWIYQDEQLIANDQKQIQEYEQKVLENKNKAIQIQKDFDQQLTKLIKTHQENEDHDGQSNLSCGDSCRSSINEEKQQQQKNIDPFFVFNLTKVKINEENQETINKYILKKLNKNLNFIILPLESFSNPKNMEMEENINKFFLYLLTHTNSEIKHLKVILFSKNTKINLVTYSMNSINNIWKFHLDANNIPNIAPELKASWENQGLYTIFGGDLMDVTLRVLFDKALFEFGNSSDVGQLNTSLIYYYTDDPQQISKTKSNTSDNCGCLKTPELKDCILYNISQKFSMLQLRNNQNLMLNFLKGEIEVLDQNIFSFKDNNQISIAIKVVGWENLSQE